MKNILFTGVLYLYCSIAVFSRSNKTWEDTETFKSDITYTFNSGNRGIDTTRLSKKYYDMLEIAVRKVPQRDKDRLKERFYKFIKNVLIYPDILLEVGEIKSIKIQHSNSWTEYSNGADRVIVRLENIKFSMRLEKIGKSLKITWNPIAVPVKQTKPDDILTCPYEEDLLKMLYGHLSQNLLAKIAFGEINSEYFNYDYLITSELAAIKNITDQNVLKRIIDLHNGFFSETVNRRLDVLQHHSEKK
jgi:hypothetical protein